MIALGSRYAHQLAVRARSVIALASLVLVARTAEAAPEPDASSVELRYAVGEGIEGCMSEPAFHDAVRARLADHSLLSANPIVVTTTIARDGPRLRATVALYESTGPSEATQEIFASRDECATLSAAAALAVSLTIERSRAHAPPSPPERSTPESPPRDEGPPPPPRRPPPARRPQPVAPDRSRREAWTYAVLTGGIGVLPSASPGASFGASFKLDRWSGGLEASALLPTTVESASGGAGAKAWLVSGAGSACVHGARAFICGVGAIGDFRAAGTGRLLSRSTDSTYVALGARAGTELPIAKPFSMVVHGTVLAPLLRPALRIEHELLWRAPLVGAELGIGVRMSIL